MQYSVHAIVTAGNLLLVAWPVREKRITVAAKLANAPRFYSQRTRTAMRLVLVLVVGLELDAEQAAQCAFFVYSAVACETRAIGRYTHAVQFNDYN